MLKNSNVVWILNLQFVNKTGLILNFRYLPIQRNPQMLDFRNFLMWKFLLRISPLLFVLASGRYNPFVSETLFQLTGTEFLLCSPVLICVHSISYRMWDLKSYLLQFLQDFTSMASGLVDANSLESLESWGEKDDNGPRSEVDYSDWDYLHNHVHNLHNPVHK